LHSGFFIFNDFSEYDYFSMNFSGHEIDNLNKETKKKVKMNQYDIYKYVDELVQMIEKFKFKNIILIGHSMGGGISLLVNQRIPNRINKLILVSPINPTIFLSTIGPKYLFNTINNMHHKIKEIEIDSKYLNNQKFYSLIDEYLNYEIERFLYMKRKYLFLGTRLLSIKLYQTLNNLYMKINKPTLVILGENDKVIPHKFFKKYLKKINNKNIEIEIIKNSKHICFVEQFDKYNEIVWNFITNKNI
ncbi:MAG: alpha/beta hydrolase, partial [Ureaplasma sp.]|nr:alpha/beta hydrolase [Ureaplasma sp.]